MTRKRQGVLLAVATLAIAATGCLSNKTTSETAPHVLKVVDAVTKLPVPGAIVKLTAPGMTMANRTDERGMIDVGAGAFSIRPKPEELEITMQGYHRIAFPLTNGLPPIVEISRVQNQK